MQFLNCLEEVCVYGNELKEEVYKEKFIRSFSLEFIG